MSRLYGAERVAQIRAKLKEKYPYIKFSITKDGYNGVNIRILEAPIDFSDEENQQAKAALKDIEDIASEGVTYRETGDYGNQPDFYVWVRVGTWDKPFVYKPSASPTTSVGGTKKPFTRGTTSTNYDKGTVVLECNSGWKVYKKTLPDNRVVYNAVKDKDVASNKDDWNAIKGEVYVEAGFKWGRFGAFERWGEIDDSVESIVLNDLCAVFKKYYKKTSQITEPTTIPTKDEYGEFVYGTNWNVPKEYGQQLVDEFYLTKEKPFLVAQTDDIRNLQYRVSFSFEITSERKKIFYINEPNLGYSFYISDKDGKFEVGRVVLLDPDRPPTINNYSNTIFYNFINYFEFDKPVEITQLKEAIIEEILDGLKYENKLKGEPIGGENTAYQNVPPNPKLEYVKINWAEGFERYTSLLPKSFNSFTAATKFIADNIGEIDELGYDKHGVEWKWTFDDTVYSDRWDIGQSLNPNTISNLWAYGYLQRLCFEAWRLSSVFDYVRANEFIKKIGKDGFELTPKQFDATLQDIISYYPTDTGQFAYNSSDARLYAFFDAYPAIWEFFKEPQPQQPQGNVEQETRNLLRSLELIRGDGTNQEIEQLIRALRLILN
jgi:hypothetical protein